MPKLWQVTKLIRSKNSGPFELTFDVIFKDRESYEKVRDAGVINTEWFARTYRLTPQFVSIINYDAANAIKITIPRPFISGDVDDTDVFGGQQHGPLVDIEVP
ncbi:MAG TPA: DUF4387 domain-containing protein [Burkholderiales bacterium]|nr:DUF4387 domain-containing protein [Burkholderiales bacterium]